MNILVFVVIITLIVLMRFEVRTYEEVPQSKYFYMSDGKSKQMYEQMITDNVSNETLEKFVAMEDRLLQLEYQSVCSRTSRINEATAISENIKERFPHYDFTYHQEHLRQVSNPSKIINKKIMCI